MRRILFPRLSFTLLGSEKSPHFTYITFYTLDCDLVKMTFDLEGPWLTRNYLIQGLNSQCIHSK